MNILCVGGGPGGLFFALATKRADPTHQVTVLERRPAATTYGWGIAVSTAPSYQDDLLHRIHAVDPETAAALRASCTEWWGQHVSVPGGRPVHLGGSGYSLGRHRLLEVLTERARALGVDVRFATEATDLRSAVRDHDLVVLADGVGGRLRRSLGDAFGTTESASPNRHVWLGTRHAFEDFTYAFEQTSAGWIWFYAYRYRPDASTVIVECSARTWAALGFDSAHEDVVLAELSEIFAAHLDGHPLESGAEPSPWESFPTVRNESWHSGNMVLLGDAAHTAHFSIGSGTKLAMEDAAALAEALADRTPGDLPTALQSYEDTRRPLVEAVQAAAVRSAAWFEHVDEHATLHPVRFGFSMRMRRNPSDGDSVSLRSTVLLGLHLLTQWRVGRAVRRALATRRRAAQRRRAEETGGPSGPASRRPETVAHGGPLPHPAE